MADRSAIAAKSELIVEALRMGAGVDVDVWFPPAASGRSHVAGQREMVPGCEAALERYDGVVYCLGDHNEYHGRILEAAWRVPGVVALHDVSLANLFYGLGVEKGFDWLAREVRRSGGTETEAFVMGALAGPHGWPGDPTAAEAVPMLAVALEGATAVITHSVFARERVARTYLGDIAVAGLPTVLAARTQVASAGNFGLIPIPADRPLVIQAGQLNPNKRTDVVLEAFGLQGLWHRATLAIVGAGKIDTVEQLRRQARRLDIERAVRFLGPVDDATLDSLRARATLAVVLRDPCLEAASAGLLDALSHGVPCVAVDHGMYAEAPDQAVRRVPAPPAPADVAAAISWWLDDPKRVELGRDSARRYVAEACSPLRYADVVLDVVGALGAARTRQLMVNGVNELLGGIDLGNHIATTERITRRAHELFGRRPRRLPARPTPERDWVPLDTAPPTAMPAPVIPDPAPGESMPDFAAEVGPERTNDRPHGLLVSYAQNGEDVVLARGLRDQTGFYVDIGAFHPSDDSVTRIFYDRGWSGINVDPVPEVVDLFRRDRSRDINVQAAISTTTGIAEMWTGPPDLIGHSTLVTSIALAHAEDGVAFARSAVETLTLEALLDRHVPPGIAIDFLKVDVEGHEEAVLASGNWQRWRPRVVVVECLAPYIAGSTHVAWEPILLLAGYRMVLFDGLNRYYVAPDEDELATTLSAPASVLDQFEKVSVRDLQDYAHHLEATYANAEQRVQALEGRAAWLEERLRYVGVASDDPGLFGG